MLTPDRLIAIEEIKQLKARYFRCVDTQELEGFLDVFTEDASFTYDLDVAGKGEPNHMRIDGRDAMRRYCEQSWGTQMIWSAHHGMTAEIDILSDTEARGIWAMQDVVELNDSHFHGYGHYREKYRKAGGTWRICALHLTRTRIIYTPKVPASR